MDESSLAHGRWNCKYHIVFIPKYRRKVMCGRLRGEAREILKTLCVYKKKGSDNRRRRMCICV